MSPRGSAVMATRGPISYTPRRAREESRPLPFHAQPSRGEEEPGDDEEQQAPGQQQHGQTADHPTERVHDDEPEQRHLTGRREPDAPPRGKPSTTDRLGR